MSVSKVKEYFKRYNKDKEILEFNESSATVADAAKAIGCEEKDIAKSMSFEIEDKEIIIVCAGDVKIDNAKYKKEFLHKAKMLKYEDVEKKIGHAPGGVCPFAINDGIKVYLDESLKRMDVVYPACGSSNSAIKLTIKELEEYSNYTKWVDVTKLMWGE